MAQIMEPATCNLCPSTAIMEIPQNISAVQFAVLFT
jgi:hypothetical protein